MRYRLIILCLLTYVCATLSAVDFPSAMPFRSTTSYWEEQQEAEAPARTGFRAIATAPTALGVDGIAATPAEMATILSYSPRKSSVNPNPPDEEDEEDKYNGTPVGDMLFPLLLMAFGYAIYRFLCRKKSPCPQQ